MQNMNWKTTLTGVIGAIAVIIKFAFGLDIPADVQIAFVVLIVFALALFSKDKDVTGGKREQE